jgi:hypothetical protein
MYSNKTVIIRTQFHYFTTVYVQRERAIKQRLLREGWKKKLRNKGSNLYINRDIN